ncbi:WAP four-disulfide core domain 3 [Perkinsus olseni]|uniref:WAP four-disulfide core domain 3 n=1 Tax=Perkinsus olseni TaxID=32597 RepID=A0A7J6LAU1_PEROL|nr:WAP four-disulfide core domain 3 [Perkinsus olseni]
MNLTLLLAPFFHNADPIAEEKPLVCPKVLPEFARLCVRQCYEDSDCGEGDRVCCGTDCGGVCIDGVPPEEVTTPQPIVEELLVCPVVFPDASSGCVEATCSEDMPCGGNELCCHNGCVSTCVAGIRGEEALKDLIQSTMAIEENPSGATREAIIAADDIGSEPLVCSPVLSGTAGICVEMCSEEQPCGREQMCCPNGCGHLCMAGVTEEEAEQIRQAQDTPSGATRAVSLLVGVVSTVVGMRMVSSVAPAQPGELCCSNGCGKVCKVGVTQAEYDKLADFNKRSITGFSLMIDFDDNADLNEIAANLNSEKLGKIFPASTESPNVSILHALKMAIVKVKTSEREDADALESFVKGIPAVSAATKSMEIEWNYAKDSAVVGRGGLRNPPSNDMILTTHTLAQFGMLENILPFLLMSALTHSTALTRLLIIVLVRAYEYRDLADTIKTVEEAHEKGTRARESEVADLKRRIEEAQQTSKDKIQKLQRKIRTLVDENGELKEANEMESLTIESLRRGQKELQGRVESLEKHREKLRQVVDHLAGQLATKDGSLRHKEVYKLTEHFEDLMASPRQQTRRDGPLVHDLGDAAAAQALVGLMPKDVAAHIRRCESEILTLKARNSSLEASNSRLVSKARAAHYRGLEAKHYKHVDTAARTILQLKRQLQEERKKREKQETYIRRLERKLLEKTTRGSTDRSLSRGGRSLDAGAVIKIAAAELGVTTATDDTTMDVRSGLFSEGFDDPEAFGMEHPRLSSDLAPLLEATEETMESREGTGPLKQVLDRWEKTQRERRDKLKNEPRARSSTPPLRKDRIGGSEDDLLGGVSASQRGGHDVKCSA